MVGLLSAEGENFDRLREAIVELHAKFQKLLPLIDTDAEAVEVYVVSCSVANYKGAV